VVALSELIQGGEQFFDHSLVGRDVLVVRADASNIGEGQRIGF
jgi:hypothetical protein